METKHKYAVLVQQIEDGLKDEHLGALQRNADRVVCYAVWKAVEARRKAIRLEKQGIKEPTYVEPNVAGWVNVGAHSALDKECIESVGRLLDAVRLAHPFIDDIETFSLAHIRCRSLAKDVGLSLCEAFTELGANNSHHVKFIAGKDMEGVPYWSVTLKSNGIQVASVNYGAEEAAVQSTLEVIRDECLL